jgi:hypothetical protein
MKTMIHLLAELDLTSYEFKEIADQFSQVPAQAIGIVAFGAFLGLVASIAFDSVETHWAVLGGMVLALLVGGFNDPSLGVEHIHPHCLELAGKCLEQPSLRPTR